MRRPSQPELQLLIDVATFLSEGISTIWPESDHSLAGIPPVDRPRSRTFYQDREGRFYREDGKAAVIEPRSTLIDVAPTLPPGARRLHNEYEEPDLHPGAYEAEVVVRLRFAIAGESDAEHARIAAIASVEDLGQQHGLDTELLTIEGAPVEYHPQWHEGNPSRRTA